MNRKFNLSSTARLPSHTSQCVRAAEPVKFFCVELRDGTKAEFALSSQPQITFSNGSMTATTPEKTITVELGRVLKYFFSSISTGISLPSKQPIGKPQVEYHIDMSPLRSSYGGYS